MKEYRTPSGTLTLVLGDVRAEVVRVSHRRTTKQSRFALRFARGRKTKHLGSYGEERYARAAALGMLERGEARDRR